MENIEIEGYSGDYFIPTVKFEVDTGICELAGESYLEETVEFYAPLLEWLEEYTTELKKPITFNFKLTYFNTSSSKRILDILHILKRYEDAGGDITTNWYLGEDAEMEDDVEDFRIVSKLDINLIEGELDE